MAAPSVGYLGDRCGPGVFVGFVGKRAVSHWLSADRHAYRAIESDPPHSAVLVAGRFFGSAHHFTGTPVSSGSLRVLVPGAGSSRHGDAVGIDASGWSSFTGSTRTTATRRHAAVCVELAADL